MSQSIHKEGRVTRLHMEFNSAQHAVHRGAHEIFISLGKARVRQIGFMAARDDHCRPVARSDIGHRNEDIYLSAEELVVVKSKLRAGSANVPAGMNVDGFTGTPNIEKCLVDKQSPAGIYIPS